MWDQKSKGWDWGLIGWVLGSQAKTEGSVFFEGSGIGWFCFVGSGITVCHAFRVRIVCGRKTGITDHEIIHLIMNLLLAVL